MKVIYQNLIYEAKINPKKKLFAEIRKIDPTRLVEITREGKTLVVQICELEVLSDHLN